MQSEKVVPARGVEPISSGASVAATGSAPSRSGEHGSALKFHCEIPGCDIAECVRPMAGGLPGARLKRVLDYINAHLGSQLRIAEMASLANTSPHHFCELFRRSVGMSPHKYVVSRRIAHAKQLLRDGRLDVGDAAFASGFANQSHFTKVFRRRTGMTPREFRASV